MKVNPASIEKSKRALESFRLLTFENGLESKNDLWGDKYHALMALDDVEGFLKSRHWLVKRWEVFDLKKRVLFLSLIAIGQEHLLQSDPQQIVDGPKKEQAFLACLEHVETFYADIGGVIGYHCKVLELLCHPNSLRSDRFLKPPKFDCAEDRLKTEEAVNTALQMWAATALIIPAGGAGDRLNLMSSNKVPLPAAFLTLNGKSLLEGIIRDLQGCEYAAFKISGKRVLTPVAIMTSMEKDNHEQILQYLQKRNWFERPKESFKLFCQPSVPMISETGEWIAHNPWVLWTKPGGHGVMWRLAHCLGVFDWLRQKGCQKAIVRQINNCLAGSDNGLLALAGFGWLLKKPLGFVCCSRLPNMAEGVNAVVEKSVRGKFQYTLENIEYNELPSIFQKESGDSGFFSNVNLLFIDLNSIQSLSVRYPLPGLTINFKASVKSVKDGQEIRAGRLESTMQNISHHLITSFDQKLEQISANHLSAFAIFCERNKVLSAAKRSLSSTSSAETPQMAYRDLQSNYFDLLKKCQFSFPHSENSGALSPLIVSLHPALGPTWDLMIQKLRGGMISAGSELQLEIAEFDCEQLELEGSLRVFSLPGEIERKKNSTSLSNSNLEGRCTLRNVAVKNGGLVDKTRDDDWSGLTGSENSWQIYLNGMSEFEACDVVFRGPRKIEVPEGYKMVARQMKDDIHFEVTPLFKSWSWNCFFHHGICQLKRETIDLI